MEKQVLEEKKRKDIEEGTQKTLFQEEEFCYADPFGMTRCNCKKCKIKRERS